MLSHAGRALGASGGRGGASRARAAAGGRRPGPAAARCLRPPPLPDQAAAVGPGGPSPSGRARAAPAAPPALSTERRPAAPLAGPLLVGAALAPPRPGRRVSLRRAPPFFPFSGRPCRAPDLPTSASLVQTCVSAVRGRVGASRPRSSGPSSRPPGAPGRGAPRVRVLGRVWMGHGIPFRVLRLGLH